MKKRIFLICALILFLVKEAIAASEADLSVIEKYLLEGKHNLVVSESAALIAWTSGARKDDLYYLKGLGELKVNKFSDARASFDYIISRHRWSKRAFDAHLGVGDSYLLEGDNSKAVDVYDEMAERYTSDSNIAIVYARLGSIYAKMGSRSKADYYNNLVGAAAPISYEAGQMSVKDPAKRENAADSPITRISENSRYSVQVGSFKSKRNADKLAWKLSRRGYKSYVEMPVLSDDKFYRVKAGKFGSKDEASGLASRLQSDGYRTKICADDLCE